MIRKRRKINELGLRRACLYSLIPYQSGGCGPKDNGKSSPLILNFIKGRMSDERKIREFLEGFKTACSNYREIAAFNGIDDFLEEKVVIAYWLGSSLLEGFYDKEKIPFHLHNVLSGSPVDIKAADICRISWGIVKKPGRSTTIECQPLEETESDFTFGDCADKKVKWNKDFIPVLKKGDWVSVHWNTMIEVLRKEEVKNLENYSQKTLNSLARVK